MPKFSVNFEGILSSADRNFERQIRSWSLAQLLLIIALLLLLMHIIINTQYNYYVSNKGLYEEYDTAKIWKQLVLLLIPVWK